MPTPARFALSSAASLVSCLKQAGTLSELVAQLRQRNSAAIDGAWGSSAALATAVIAEGHAASAPGATLLVITPRLSEVDDLAYDLQALMNQEVAVFPAWESLPHEHTRTDPIFSARLQILKQLESATPPRLLVTSIPALMQPVPSREFRQKATRRFDVGEDLDLDQFIDWLIEHGMERVTQIEAPGEFRLQGGILDVFPADSTQPVRFEFFGDEIDSLRYFDVETQRQTEKIDHLEMTFVEPVPFGQTAEKSEKSAVEGSSLLDSLPEQSWVVMRELEELIDEGKHYLQRLDSARGLYSVQAVLKQTGSFPSTTVSAIGASSYDYQVRLSTESIERFTGPTQTVLSELKDVIDRDAQVLLLCHNEGERQRLSELLVEHINEVSDQITLAVGTLTQGFRLVDQKIIVLSDHELFGRKDVRGVAKGRKFESRAIDSFLDLSPGDLVVHLSHGIGRFCGMELTKTEHSIEEQLILEFADNVRVRVPVSLIHLVQKYIGAAKALPKLSKLGAAGWGKKKQKVAQAVSDMASDMIRLQAERDSKPGISYPPDSHWQQEFEASFPYQETEDQLRSMTEIRDDMQRSRPMDRLVCGDVGFGKTEVAMRAAFRAIDAGRQVAMLVPTTVLSEQHYRSFQQRMAEYPFTVAGLSRFRTKKEQQKIVEGLETGAIDLVIGTHRLVSPDVRFKDLGLLIIDEEQRFGVQTKEMLKHMRLEIDVLTLSATPIPRTLHFSLLGIRDISNLQTPPRDRQAVETRISAWDDNLIRQAIVRELNRGGQVYFVHNRVHNIRMIADKIQSLVPEATIGIVHGQMSERELEVAMYDFVTGRSDILVATTIIESGLDIPNANTMLIHEADHYGLADLHQLRGRVGRDKHRAYCYLILKEGRTLSSTSAKRLKAIEEYSELGAGFKIAMRDLEIRGAGNILGTEQSGHISLVGYELYCQLLENAVRAQKQMPLRQHPHVHINIPNEAYFPGDYVPPGRPKIDLYRKLSQISDHDLLNELEKELRDRFGALPKQAENLLQMKDLQLRARSWQIDTIRLEDGFFVFDYRNAILVKELQKQIGDRFRVVNKSQAYVVPDSADETWSSCYRQLKALLRVRETSQ